MLSAIQAGIKSGHGTALLYATAFGMIASDIIPTPADGLYFYQQRKWKQQLNEKKITPYQYWLWTSLAYYTYNPAYWGLVFAGMYLTKGDYKKKAKVGLAILASGLVIAVISNNIKKDKELGY